MCVWKLKFWSKVTPRFLADVDGFVSLPIRFTANKDKYFQRCCSRPVRRNSVLHRLASNLFKSIQFQTESRQDFEIVGWMSHLKKMKCRVDYRQHKDDAVWNGPEWPCWEESCTLWIAPVPSTEPWGTSKGIWVTGERSLSSLISWLLSIKIMCEENQFSVWPESPYQFRSLIKSISWSMISKAADKSSKVRATTLPWSTAISTSLWIRRSAVSVEWYFL